MKVSVPQLRVTRRLASEVLDTANAKIQSGATASENAAFFNELPPILQNFFQKYPPAPFREYATTPRATNDSDMNPFLANKHPITQKWHKPQYSMRQQADIWKAAYRFGIQHLLPQLLHNRKFYEEKYDEGVKVRGAHQFKYTSSERKAPARAKEVAEAVAQLDAKILERKGRRFGKYLESKDRVGHV